MTLAAERTTGVRRFNPFVHAVVVTLTIATTVLGAGDVKVFEKPAVNVQQAVDKGLHFLASVQEKDGSWRCEGAPIAGACLALLAFRSAGHDASEGPYAPAFKKGMAWVLDQVNKDGLLSDKPNQMYEQAIGVLLLAQRREKSDAEWGEKVRPKLTAAVQVILRAQRLEGAGLHKGGWRYRIDSMDADLSVTGWQILALLAARQAGVDVPDKHFDQALDFVLRCRDPASGGFCYVPGGTTTTTCTAFGIVALESARKVAPKSPEATRAATHLLRHPPAWDEAHCLSGIYVRACAMLALEKPFWDAFRPTMHKLLLDRQQPNGSWIGSDGFGPVYGTAMAVLALAVEYRNLPLYHKRAAAPDK